MFCIEQYALAMALAEFLGEHHLGDDAVMLFERELILLQHDGRMSFDVVTKIPAHLSGGSMMEISNISGLSLIYRLSGLNLSNLSGSGISGLGLSQLLSQFSTSGPNISGLQLSSLNLSGINLSSQDQSTLNVLAQLGRSIYGSTLSGLNLSGLNLSGLNLSGLNISGLSLMEILERMNLSGINFSGLNISGLTMSENQKLMIGTAVNLSGIDYKLLQQGVDTSMQSTPYNDLTLVDNFGNSFIHYYHQNFEPLKDGALQGGTFPELFSKEVKKF